LRKGLLFEFITSQKMFLIVLIFIPFVLSISFLNVLYNDDNLKSDFYEHKNIPVEADKYLVENEEAIYEEKLKTNNLEKRLAGIEKNRFFSSFYNSLFSVSKIGIVLGALAASLSNCKLVSNGSIIYQITNKSSRKESFIEFFSLPLPFIITSTLVGTLAISSISIKTFDIKNIHYLLSITFITILLGILEGYIFGVFFGLASKEIILPILVTIGAVFALPLYDNTQYILLPYKPFIMKLFDNIHIKNSNWIIGLTLICLSLVASYILYKRGDYY